MVFIRLAILGGGISALSLADILQKRYGIIADIFEKEKDLGGLCRTKIGHNYIYDLSGGHVYNSKYEQVNEYIFSLLPKDKWNYYKRIAMISMDNKIFSYPFEFSLSQLPEDIQVDCIDQLYKASLSNKQYSNLEEFFVAHFGSAIYQHYLKKYNEKIWKRPLIQLDYDWVEGKMPCPNPKDVLYKTITQDKSENNMVHATYFYPKESGIQTLIKQMTNDKLKNIFLSNEIGEILFHKELIEVNGLQYDLVVSTIPLPELSTTIVDLPTDVKQALESLEYNSLHSILYKIENKNNWSWLYLPDRHILPHRVVYQGNLAGVNGDTSYATVEYIPDQTNTEVDYYTLRQNINKELHVIEELDSSVTKYAYVVFDKSRRYNLNTIKDYLKPHHFILHGRFGKWEYPNMDICIKDSLALAKEISEWRIQ